MKFVNSQGTELLVEVDASVLPPSMGGTRPAEDRLVTDSDGEHTPCFGRDMQIRASCREEVASSSPAAAGFVPASWTAMDDAIAAEHSRLQDSKLGNAAGHQVSISAQAQP